MKTMITIPNRGVNLLAGKLAVLNVEARELERTYYEVFRFGYADARMAQLVFMFDRASVKLMFTDDFPVGRGGVMWYCLREVGGCGTMHWFTLAQLTLINE